MKNNLYNYWLCEKPTVVSIGSIKHNNIGGSSFTVKLSSGRQYSVYIRDYLNVSGDPKTPNHIYDTEVKVVKNFVMEG